MNILTTVIFFILLTSCGKSVQKSSKQKIGQNKQVIFKEMQGIYHAILKPINKKLTPELNGALTLARYQDEFVADIRLSFGPKNVAHEQNIHLGERCPEEQDDLNHDSYIDHEEGKKVFEKIIIPLDDDINLQRMGSGIFPKSDSFGHYLWSRLASFEKLLHDLLDEDLNTEDDILKFQTIHDFSIINKVVIIKGIEDSVDLPETVKGSETSSPQQLIPIACGKIYELKTFHNTEDEDPQIATSGSNPDDGADFNTTGESDNNYGND